MKVFLVVDETRFFQPGFLAEFLRRTNAEVVGAALVTRVPPSNSIESYFIKNWGVLRLREIVRLVLWKASIAIRDRLGSKSVNRPFYSVASVLRFFKVGFIAVKDDINQYPYLSHIRALQPDVIISSNSLIFREELLSIPKIGCINRHSALLPSYGGLWPVFQAVRSGESETGVTVHWMDAGIDTGSIISQKSIRVSPDDSVADVYEKCFAISADVVLDALGRIERKDMVLSEQACASSYFSFPTAEHWAEFRSRGRRFI